MREQFDMHLEKSGKDHYYQMEKLLSSKKYSTSEVIDNMFAKEIKISIHSHPLKMTFNNMCWYCDSLTDSPDQICLMGHSKEHEYHDYPKFKCTQGCNRTYCPKCAYQYLE